MLVESVLWLCHAENRYHCWTTMSDGLLVDRCSCAMDVCESRAAAAAVRTKRDGSEKRREKLCEEFQLQHRTHNSKLFLILFFHAVAAAAAAVRGFWALCCESCQCIAATTRLKVESESRVELVWSAHRVPWNENEKKTTTTERSR